MFGPEDEGFAAEVAGFNLAAQHRPEVAVGITSEADAVAVVRAAADSGTPVRVLATGHGSPRSIEGGVLVTTSRMSKVTIDGRIAHIEAGCRWAEVVAAAAEHGLAPITGASDAVGCIGYTLGGGLGPLSRTYGVSSDWARGFRVVTGAGEVVTANADENADLFWALRGGKGGLGLVTSMDFELVELSTLYGGSLFFGTDDIGSVLTTWLEWTKTLPETANSSVAMLRLPPLDAIPEPIRGKTTLAVRYAFVGDPAEGERLFQPIRDAGTAILGGVGEMPASDIALIHNDPKDPVAAWDRAVLLNEVDADFATTFLDVAGPDRQLPLVAIEIRHPRRGDAPRRTGRQCGRRPRRRLQPGDDRRPRPEPVRAGPAGSRRRRARPAQPVDLARDDRQLRRRLDRAGRLRGVLAGGHVYSAGRSTGGVRPEPAVPVRPSQLEQKPDVVVAGVESA